jgi:galactoside O-acetyltransferase
MKNSYIYAHDNGILKIGDNFAMNSNAQLGASFGKIIIGDNCSIAPNCVLRASNHKFNKTNIPLNKQGHKYGEIILEDDVWIASNCVILSGAILGQGSVISANSVISSKILPYSIMIGNPARIIGNRKKMEEK